MSPPNRHLSLFEDESGAEEISGTVKRIIFHNPDNGFTVFSMQLQDKPESDDPTTCVGHILYPKLDMNLLLRGRYSYNAKYSELQFAFNYYEEIRPAGLEQIRQYLSSKIINGIGPALAERIVEKFGENTYKIFDESPHLLLKISGIGKKNYERICQSWKKHRSLPNLFNFLQPHGIGMARTITIFKAYGEDSENVVRNNPYRLAMDIRGIGFTTADSIGAKLGFAPDNILRVKGAILYVLQKAADDGHVYLPLDKLLDRVCEQLNISAELVEPALKELEGENRLVCELLAKSGSDSSEAMGVYLSYFHTFESKISYYLNRLLASPKSAYFEKPEEMLADVLKTLPFKLAPEQEQAVFSATKNKVLVITGGPGTGKTTIINAIIRLFDQIGASILLAAPTGRASKRMAEATGKEAKTIHRLLEYRPGDDMFARNEDNPLACKLLVVDEASMMDTMLFYYLLKAIPMGATLVLVGDVHQLPSVGPGNVLGDIIASGVATVVELNKIFRQSAQSQIICNAHLINNGHMPKLANDSENVSDFYFIERNNPDEAAETIVEVIKNRIPRRFNLDPVNDVQLLTPMHKGTVGAESMNRLLQQALNPHGLELSRGDKKFRLHDKVMQVRNNYDKDIYNGDIGAIESIDLKNQSLAVDFDGVIMPYEFEELDELVPAYAISIHKSQGSEYPAVVIPVMKQHYALLQRNLVYTGVTRGKRLVVVVGEVKALEMAVRNNRTSKRYTRLAQRLAGEI